MNRRRILELVLRKVFPINHDDVIIGDFTDDLFVIHAKLFSKTGALVSTFHVSIFSHEFAKDLWGDDYPDFPEEEAKPEFRAYYPHWKFQLRQMVIADDPIAYLGNYLTDYLLTLK